MQFLRTLFWVVLAVVGAIFAYHNWHVVRVDLWGDLKLYSPLPMLLLSAFLIGLVPTFILYRTTRWSLRRQLDAALRSGPAAETPPPLPAPEASLPAERA